MESSYFTRGEKEYLLKVARLTLEAWVYRRETYEPQTVNQKLWVDCGLGVVLYREKEIAGQAASGEMPMTLLLGIRDLALKCVRQADNNGIMANELPEYRFEIAVTITGDHGDPETVVFTEGN